MLTGGIFLRLTIDLYFSKRIKPRPKKEGHHKKSVLVISAAPTASMAIILSSTARKKFSYILQGLNWRIEPIRKASTSAVIVGHTYLYYVASQSRKVICYFGLQLIGTKYEYL